MSQLMGSVDLCVCFSFSFHWIVSLSLKENIVHVTGISVLLKLIVHLKLEHRLRTHSSGGCLFYSERLHSPERVSITPLLRTALMTFNPVGRVQAVSTEAEVDVLCQRIKCVAELQELLLQNWGREHTHPNTHTPCHKLYK